MKLEKVLCDAEEWPWVLCVHTILGIVRSFLVKLFAKPEVLNWNVLTEGILLLIYNLNTSWGRLWDDAGKPWSTLLPSSLSPGAHPSTGQGSQGLWHFGCWSFFHAVLQRGERVLGAWQDQALHLMQSCDPEGAHTRICSVTHNKQPRFTHREGDEHFEQMMH